MKNPNIVKKYLLCVSLLVVKCELSLFGDHPCRLKPSINAAATSAGVAYRPRYPNRKRVSHSVKFSHEQLEFATDPIC